MKNVNILNAFFTRKSFLELIENGTSSLYETIIDRYTNPSNCTNGEIIRQIYRHLIKNNRNEYFYLNTVLLKLLSGKYSVNSAAALTQLRVSNSIADFVLIHDKGTIYEIKSDLDNLSRLHSQIENYFKAFPLVSVVVSKAELSNIRNHLAALGRMGDSVGIYLLSDRITISQSGGRQPTPFYDHLDHYTMFSTLRKKEYESIIISKFDRLPEVPPAFYFSKCFEQFKRLCINEAHNLFLRELKKRNRISAEDFKKIPIELKSLVYFNNLTSKLDKILDFLDKKYEEV